MYFFFLTDQSGNGLLDISIKW